MCYIRTQTDLYLSLWCRRWIQGEFCLLHSDLKSKHEENGVEAENDIDLSEGVAALFEPNLSLEVGWISIDNNWGIKKWDCAMCWLLHLLVCTAAVIPEFFLNAEP